MDNFFNKMTSSIARIAVYIYVAIKNFFIALAQNIKKISVSFANGVVKFFKNQAKIIKFGNWKTRLSYLIMGFGHMTQKQIAKGVIFLVTQIVFIYMMISFCSKYLVHFFTLGTTISTTGEYGEVIFIHYSPIILLYCVFSFALIIGFLMIYFAVVKSAFKNQLIIEKGEVPKGLLKELDEFLNEKFHITLLSLPTLGVLLFSIIPLVFMILVAFTNYDSAHLATATTFDWVGFKNFNRLLFSGTHYSSTFWSILGWTLIWAFFATFTNYFGGMLLALLINKKGIRGKKVWRLFFVLSIAVPQFVSLLLMNQLFHESGLINSMLKRFDIIEKSIPFLSSTTHARILVIVINMWVGIPYSLLITSGLLMNIPTELYESAEIDGATPAKRFRHITLPYILFATAPFLITQFIGNINNFNVIYLLTGGGPTIGTLHGGTDLLVTWLFKLTTASDPDYSLASTIGCMVFTICAILSLIIYNKTAAVKHEGEMQ